MTAPAGGRRCVLPRPLVRCALSAATIHVTSAQYTYSDKFTWAGGLDEWAEARTLVANVIALLFTVECVLWCFLYGRKAMREKYHRAMVEARVRQRLEKESDMEQQMKSSRNEYLAGGPTHLRFAELRSEARKEHDILSPRVGGGHAKAPAPYNPHRGFARVARAGTKASFTEWQKSEELPEHHRMLVDGRRAALV